METHRSIFKKGMEIPQKKQKKQAAHLWVAVPVGSEPETMVMPHFFRQAWVDIGVQF